MQLAFAQLNVTVGAIQENTKKIKNAIGQAKSQGADILIFPELVICGYPPLDLLDNPAFLTSCEKALEEITKETENIAIVLGTIRKNTSGKGKALFNSAAIIENKHLIGFQDKRLIPSYDVFYERRYFEPGQQSKVWNICSHNFWVTICEDLWNPPLAHELFYIAPDTKKVCIEAIINISASPFTITKQKQRLDCFTSIAEQVQLPILFCNQVGGNDSLIFDGKSFVLNAEGECIDHLPGWEECITNIHLKKQTSNYTLKDSSIEDIQSALILGIQDYFYKNQFQKACLGLSGGIDSSLVAALATKALGKENILGLLMPSRFSSKGSIEDAIQLCKNLGIQYHTLSIENTFQSLLDTLQPYFGNQDWNTAEENMQSRIRALLLMAFANKFNYLLLNTGNKSELAMGYCTLYGDMCGCLGSISDLYKTQVYALAKSIKEIPKESIEKSPSAELRAEQKDIDSLPDYPLLDSILQLAIEENLPSKDIADKIKTEFSFVDKILKIFHQNEFKRQQAPIPLIISKKALTVGRRFPITHHFT
jgi:NAD+ synthase (glutamine-hydrolysing)